MDRLPLELVEAILDQSIAICTKRNVLDLRLVCRLFDRILKPYACRTLNLGFSKLSKRHHPPPPRSDALQTIGNHCEGLYIDLMVLRDEST